MHKGFKFLAIGLVVMGVILAWLAFVVQGKPAPLPVAGEAATPSGPATQRVLVVRHAVEAGQVLTAEDVQMQSVAMVPAGAVADERAVVGRGVAKALAAGEPVTTDSLLQGVAGMLEPGERAVAVKVDESTAVGHKVQPGDWVDVLVVLRKEGQEVPDTQARRLLERKRVLAYGAQVEQLRIAAPPATASTAASAKDMFSKSAGATEQSHNSTLARTAVLAVQAGEVNALVLAERHGQVLLALRSPMEPVAAGGGPENAEGVAFPGQQDRGAALQVVTLEQLAAHAGSRKPDVAKPVPAIARPQPVRAPRPQATGIAVEFIRGTRTETVHY